MAIPRWVGILLLVLGVLAVIGGVVFLTVPAHSLPSFVPGHIAGSTRHHTKRGIAGVIVGVVLLVVGGILGRGGPSKA